PFATQPHEDGVADAGTMTAGGVAGTFTVSVITDASLNGTITLTAKPTPAPPTITTAAVPAGGVSEPYRYQVPVTGVPAPKVTKLSGSLPPGITLSSAGLLSGTPTAAGTYTFGVKAANGVGSPATGTVSLVVRAKPKLTIANASAAEGTGGTKKLTF